MTVPKYTLFCVVALATLEIHLVTSSATNRFSGAPAIRQVGDNCATDEDCEGFPAETDGDTDTCVCNDRHVEDSGQ